MRSSMSTRRSVREWLSEPVDNAPLVIFRALFGLLLFLEAAGSIATGWVGEVYVEPQYRFPHMGFGWLQGLHGPGMYAYYAAMSVPGLLIMLGAYFRPALTAYTVLWALVYFGQTTRYNNHYYLVLLLCLLLWPTPANADFSVDAAKGRVQRSAYCPRWCIGIFVLQVAIVYFYAAFAKLEPDWLAGRPIRIWMQAKAGVPVLGQLYVQPWFQKCLVYGGILFDGSIVPLLLWRRTRRLAVGLAVFFHLFNSITFRIGIFPYMGIGFCLFFFPGGQVRRWLRSTRLAPWFAEPGLGRDQPGRQMSRALLVVFAAYFTFQVLMPLRHFLYPGDSNWTEQGHRMAWRMMLRSKSGSAVLRVVDRDTGESWKVYPRQDLSAKQRERVATRPDMMWRYSRHVRERYEQEGRDVEVYADTRVSLNGRPAQPLIDPEVDLSRAPWTWFEPLPWLVPLETQE
jgi:hypothetical protein